MSEGPRCPRCQTSVQPTWDWCEACGWDPADLKPPGWQPGPAAGAPTAPPAPPSPPPPAPVGFPGPPPPGPAGLPAPPPPGPAGFPTGPPPPGWTPRPPVNRTRQVVMGVAAAVLLFLVVPLLAVTFLGRSASTRAVPGEDVGSGGAVAGIERWASFTPPSGAFTVEMPGRPRQQVEPATSMTPGMDMWLVEGSRGAVMVGVSDLPPEMVVGADSNELLDNAVEGSRMSTGAELIDVQSVTVQGHPARQANMRIEDGELWASYILTPERLVVVLSIGVGDRRPDHDRMISTLQLH